MTIRRNGMNERSTEYRATSRPFADMLDTLQDGVSCNWERKCENYERYMESPRTVRHFRLRDYILANESRGKVEKKKTNDTRDKPASGFIRC